MPWISGGCQPSAGMIGYVTSFIDLTLHWQGDSD